MSASDFIRGLPSDMSVGEVMERGRAAGLEFSLDLVRKVRQRLAQSGGKGRKPGRPRKGEERQATAAKPGRKPKAAAEERGGRGGEAKGKARRGAARPTESKAAFIESFSHDTPASEVVAAGKAAGLKFSPSYVYYVRGAGQRRGKSSEQPSQPSRQQASAPRQSSSQGGSVDQDESAFFDLVLRVGLTRAQHLLGQVRERLSSLVGVR